MPPGRTAGVVASVVALGLMSTGACRDDPSPESDTRTTPAAVPPAADPPASRTEITLYFTDAEELRVADCGAVLPTRRSVPDSLVTPPRVLRILLDGVTVAERAAGLSSQFDPTPAVGANRPLADYLLGMEVKEGTAFLDFAPGALAYLNNAACLQAAVKQPMIRTLQEFPDIDRVVFRIGGEPFEDWDA